MTVRINTSDPVELPTAPTWEELSEKRRGNADGSPATDVAKDDASQIEPNL